MGTVKVVIELEMSNASVSSEYIRVAEWLSKDIKWYNDQHPFKSPEVNMKCTKFVIEEVG